MRNDEGRGHKHNEGRRATDIQCGELVSLVGGGDMRDRAVPLAAVADELRVRVPENGQCGGDHDDMLGWMLAGRVLLEEGAGSVHNSERDRDDEVDVRLRKPSGGVDLQRGDAKAALPAVLSHGLRPVL